MANTLRTLGPKAAAALDEELMSSGAFSIDQLMELAGLAVSQAMYSLSPPSKSPNILVACGPGNNGGDGLVAARHLHHFGYKPTMYYPKQSKNELYQRLRTQLEQLKVPFTDDFQSAAGKSDWIIDAIFGFSFSGEVREPFPAVIKALAESKVPVLAVDAPSSWNIEDGPPKDGPGKGYNPDALISLTAPKPLVNWFSGRHFVGGRFVSREIAEKYGFDVPPYKGCDQIIEVGSHGEKLIEEEVEEAGEVMMQQRNQDNTESRLLKLPPELRNKIYDMLDLPRGQWLSPYDRWPKSKLAPMQTCRALRADLVGMLYGDNTFVIDLRQEGLCLAAWQWLNTSPADGIAALRKLRVLSVTHCPCKASVEARIARGVYYETAPKLVDQGKLNVTITVYRACQDQPYGVSVEACGLCGERPMHIAGMAKRLLEGMDLEEQSTVLDREDLVGLLAFVQSISPYHVEEDDDGDDDM